MGHPRARYQRSLWAVGLACLAMSACDDSGPPQDDSTAVLPKLKVVALAPGVSELAVPEGETRWTSDSSFVELVPPIAVPSNHASGEQVAVYISIAKGAKIEADGRGGLRMPPGTRVDRLEWVESGAKRSLADVRGTRIDQDGVAWDHTLRRTSFDSKTGLVGYEWPALDASAHRNATKALVARAETLVPAKNMQGDKRRKYLAGISRKNECLLCHQPDRAAASRRGEYGVVSRGTDGTGFFTPLAVLRDVGVLESYGNFDPNREREAIRVSCEGELERKGEGDKARVHCKGREIPRATYDAELAARSEVERHARVCASRRYLLEHMTQTLRSKYKGLLKACP